MHVICAVFPSKHKRIIAFTIAPHWDTRYESIFEHSLFIPFSDESLSARSTRTNVSSRRHRLEEPDDDTLESLLRAMLSAAKVVLFPVAVLSLASLASEARYRSRLSRVLQPSDVRRSPSRAREYREEQDWYFEQCRFVNAWKEHLGHVSVLAFLDPAWQYSFRQAVMLELLSSRLRKSGFPDVRFFVISPSPDSKSERSEDDLEIEAWREIGAKYEMESFVGDDFLRGNGADITFLQDDPQSRIWERFRASREQAIVIDRCGKLTYHVIVPWSILFFPYVKGAILSTYMEDPCGGCDPAVYRAPNHEDHVVEPIKEEASPTHREIDGKLEIILTTENPENVTLRYDESSSEEARETSTTSSSLLKKITNDSDSLDLSTKLPTESTTYRYDNETTESRFDEDRSEDTRSYEDSTNSTRGDIVFSGSVATFEPQQNVLAPEQKGSRPSANNDLLSSGNHEDVTDHTLLLESTTGVTESDSMSAIEVTTNVANEIRDITTLENAEYFGEDAFLPLRIIMYAPHVHKNGKKMKKQTHLILKFGDSDFHGHLDSEVNDASPTVVSRVESSEEYDWKTTEADPNEDAQNQNYTFDGNESPGLYGEVADYWKSYEDSDITDRNETFNDTYNSTKSEESYSVANVTEDPKVESSTDLQNIIDSNTIESSRPNANDQVDKEEGEIRYKLIEHYNKLLSWIDYRLNK